MASWHGKLAWRAGMTSWHDEQTWRTGVTNRRGESALLLEVGFVSSGSVSESGGSGSGNSILLWTTVAMGVTAPHVYLRTRQNGYAHYCYRRPHSGNSNSKKASDRPKYRCGACS